VQAWLIQLVINHCLKESTKENFMVKNWFAKNKGAQLTAILLVAVFVMLTANVSLFKHIVEIYPFTVKNLPFLVSLGVFFTLVTTLFFMVVSFGRKGRWLIALLLLLSAQAAYYMDQFSVLMDIVMIDNILNTDAKEIEGLLNISFVFRVLLLGVLPAWLVIKYWPSVSNVAQEVKARLKWMLIFTSAIIVVVLPFTAGYASFIREHKIARFYANPTYPVYSLIKYGTQFFASEALADISKTAEDAAFMGPISRHELVVMVVGETARADRFSLNGYHKLTNPRLVKEAIVSFSNVASCGTSTGVSVPCMFSSLGRKDYEKNKALNQENALDVLADHGIEVLWRDNNSNSKGVATRVEYQDFKTPTFNPVCEGECRDIGMLNGLEKYIVSKKGKDIIIVLHQMGNHGPEYYRRYPKEFKHFQPMCMTGELRDCTQEEVDNSYDNAILYTDYFLSEVINFLKKYDGDYETAMLYVSDHGESLGEHGAYLHAAPYVMAPKEQTHVPAILWLGQHFDYHLSQVTPYKDYPFSHDDLFCTLLVAYELDSKICDAKKNILMQNLDIQAVMKKSAKVLH
jgi:lipid A ethanolaminephosphotransferase